MLVLCISCTHVYVNQDVHNLYKDADLSAILYLIKSLKCTYRTHEKLLKTSKHLMLKKWENRKQKFPASC